MALVVQAADQTRIGVFQEIQVARRPLDVGERHWIDRFQDFMPLPAHDEEPRITNQFLVMLLTDSKKVDHLTVKIV